MRLAGHVVAVSLVTTIALAIRLHHTDPAPDVEVVLPAHTERMHTRTQLASHTDGGEFGAVARATAEGLGMIVTQRMLVEVDNVPGRDEVAMLSALTGDARAYLIEAAGKLFLIDYLDTSMSRPWHPLTDRAIVITSATEVVELAIRDGALVVVTGALSKYVHAAGPSRTAADLVFDHDAQAWHRARYGTSL
ncbi:MAG: hypothetical protein ABI867_01400 [Kofleriaceae bacterium]